jgi:hypothetical protein
VQLLNAVVSAALAIGFEVLAALPATGENPQGKLTIGLDLGDRSSWYCVLNEAGEVIHE